MARFKLMVVELYKNGKPAKEISQELGIRVELVCRWKRELDRYEQASFTGNGKVRQTEEQAEIARLKKELIETRIERDILKKAAAGARSASFPKAMTVRRATNFSIHEGSCSPVCH